MELKALSSHDQVLLRRAKGLAKKRKWEYSEVATVLETDSEKVFEGVNLMFDTCHPISICAEYSAVAQMVGAGQKKIKTIVTVNCKDSGFKVLSPCGHCRQLLIYFGNPYVIVPVGKTVKKVKLRELMPLAYK